MNLHRPTRYAVLIGETVLIIGMIATVYIWTALLLAL